MQIAITALPPYEDFVQSLLCPAVLYLQPIPTLLSSFFFSLFFPIATAIGNPNSNSVYGDYL